MKDIQEATIEELMEELASRWGNYVMGYTDEKNVITNYGYTEGGKIETLGICTAVESRIIQENYNWLDPDCKAYGRKK